MIRYLLAFVVATSPMAVHACPPTQFGAVSYSRPAAAYQSPAAYQQKQYEPPIIVVAPYAVPVGVSVQPQQLQTLGYYNGANYGYDQAAAGFVQRGGTEVFQGPTERMSQQLADMVYARVQQRMAAGGGQGGAPGALNAPNGVGNLAALKEKHCSRCHAGTAGKGGGYSLDGQLDPLKLANCLKRITTDNQAELMPKGTTLTGEERGALVTAFSEEQFRALSGGQPTLAAPQTSSVLAPQQQPYVDRSQAAPIGPQKVAVPPRPEQETPQ